MTTADTVAIIQTVLAVGAFIFTYFQFRAWKSELLGIKKIELAIRLGKTALQLRNDFDRARTPLNKDSAEFEKYLQEIVNRLQELYDLRVELLMICGENIENEVKTLNARYHELVSAMARVARDKADEPTYDLVYRSSSDRDAFDQSVQDVTERLFLLAQKYSN